MKTRELKMDKLGKAAEMIVGNYYISKGCRVEFSIDQFDSEKDLLIDGAKIEVKAQVPFVYENAFTFRENQLKKCLSADGVFFVSVPNKKHPHFSAGKVYLANPKELVINRKLTKDGRTMVLVRINQPAISELFTMSEKDCKILQRYSVSGWN